MYENTIFIRNMIFIRDLTLCDSVHAIVLYNYIVILVP